MVSVASAAEPVTESFTDSRGRSLLYRYSLEDDWDPEQPRGLLIFFHGNDTGTQEDMLRRLSAGADYEELAWSRGLVPVVTASPDAFDRRHFDQGSVHVWRNWDVQKDIHLVHELLQSDLGGAVSVDHDRIVFFGGSQGTVFINRFFEKYGEHYGGGLYALCGPLREVATENMMVPSPEFKKKFRVMIHATTEDFIYHGAVKAFGHYKYTLGLETRGDLARSGGHCGRGDIARGDAVDWLLGDLELPDDAPQAHFRRVSTLDYIRGMTVDSSGVLWVVRQPPYPGEDATLWRSVDRGSNWESVARMDLRVTDLDAVHDRLLLGTASGLYRSVDGAKSFERVLPMAVERVVTDPRNGLFLSSRDESGGSDIHKSEDSGRTWTLWSAGTGALQRDPILVGESAHVIAGNAIRPTHGGAWSAFSDSVYGPVYSAAWDGTALWGLFGERWAEGQLLRSVDKGAFWTDVGPHVQGTARGMARFASISALGRERLLVYQFNFGAIGYRYGSALMSEDSGGEWTSVLGGPRTNGGALGQQWIAAHPYFADVFVTTGTGIFSLETPGRSDRRVFNYLVSGSGLTLEDADSDGVVNAADAFPFDALEYLDTDGDGVGNGVDPDDDGDGVDDVRDGAPLDRFETVDTDGDGIGDELDADDDGDRVEDIFDAFPLDAYEWADADGDGIGDISDLDDDGDGVEDILDPFPTNALEWRDTDGDGIGDHLDRDDDNDGLQDDMDEEPRRGESINHLAITRDISGATSLPRLYSGMLQHPERPASYSYPEPLGDCPVYGSIRLGDGAAGEFQWMMDTPSCGYGSPKSRVYLDRNGNGLLTDDGPPIIVDHNRPAQVQLDVHYASGDIFPYYLEVGVEYTGTETMRLIFAVSSMWSGELAAPQGPVDVWIVDGNSDAVFQADGDYLCIDLNRDRRTDCWPWVDGTTRAERIEPGEHFTLDGQLYRAAIPPSGHKLDLVPVNIDDGASTAAPARAARPAAFGGSAGVHRQDQ